MKLIKYISFPVLIITLFFIYKLYSENKIKNAKTAKLICQDTIINLEIAKTDAQRTLGLMFRKKLDEDRGMIFIFDNEDTRTFWMKNTYISLDIIFVSKNLKINRLYKKLKPYTDNTADKDIEKVSGKAKYVIEVNAGMIDKLKLKENQKIKIVWN